jgi:hypothetical protein
VTPSLILHLPKASALCVRRIKSKNENKQPTRFYWPSLQVAHLKSDEYTYGNHLQIRLPDWICKCRLSFHLKMATKPVSEQLIWFRIPRRSKTSTKSVISNHTLDTAATTGLVYQPQMIGDGDCGEIGGMKIGRGNRSTRRKPAPPPLCPPQIPHD